MNRIGRITFPLSPIRKEKNIQIRKIKRFQLDKQNLLIRKRNIFRLGGVHRLHFKTSLSESIHFLLTFIP